jgi:hypothetical protein
LKTYLSTFHRADSGTTRFVQILLLLPIAVHASLGLTQHGRADVIRYRSAGRARSTPDRAVP